MTDASASQLDRADYARRYAAAVLASDPDFSQPLGDVELLDSWAECVDDQWFVRTTYRSSFYPQITLGIREKVPEELRDEDGVFVGIVEPDPERAGADMADDQMLWEPLGRLADLLVEEDGVWWWGDGYPDLAAHPDFQPFQRGDTDMTEWHLQVQRLPNDSPFALSQVTSTSGGEPSVYSAFVGDGFAGQVFDLGNVFVRETGWISGQWRLEVGMSPAGPWYAAQVWHQVLTGDVGADGSLGRERPEQWFTWIVRSQRLLRDIAFDGDTWDERLSAADRGRTRAGECDLAGVPPARDIRVVSSRRKLP